jgi:hypothetical protein
LAHRESAEFEKGELLLTAELVTVLFCQVKVSVHLRATNVTVRVTLVATDLANAPGVKRGYLACKRLEVSLPVYDASLLPASREVVVLQREVAPTEILFPCEEFLRIPPFGIFLQHHQHSATDENVREHAHNRH